MYVSSLFSGEIVIVDVAARSIAGTVTPGTGACHLATSSDGSRVYATDQDRDLLVVMDPTGKVLDTVRVGDLPGAVTAGTDGRVYVINLRQATLSIVTRGG